MGVAHQAGTTSAGQSLKLNGQEHSHNGFTITFARELFIPNEQVYLPLGPGHGTSDGIQTHDLDHLQSQAMLECLNFGEAHFARPADLPQRQSFGQSMNNSKFQLRQSSKDHLPIHVSGGDGAGIVIGRCEGIVQLQYIAAFGLSNDFLEAVEFAGAVELGLGSVSIRATASSSTTAAF